MPDMYSTLAANGVSRRSFLKFCGTLAVAAGLSELAAPKVAQALEDSVIGATEGNLFPVVWIEGASCTGCTESFAQVETPNIGKIVLDMLSLNYCDTLSAGAGHSIELAKKQTVEAGNYLLVYEGAVPRAFGGNALRVGGHTGTEEVLEVAQNAAAVVAVGSCAVNGGWMAADPNPADAVGIQQFLEDEGISQTVVNLPGCPVNPEHLVSLLVEVLMLDGKTLELDSMNKPVGIFGQTVHDNCERRGHFANGEFVYEFGSKEEALGYCLYPLGCRGPQTMSNCGVTLWNNRRSWCVQAGSPCIGCCEANPMKPKDNWVQVNTPFYKRHRNLYIGDWKVQPQKLAFGITGLLAACLVIHGFGMKKTGRTDGGADFEQEREWDIKHPDNQIAVNDPEVLATAARAQGVTPLIEESEEKSADAKNDTNEGR